MGRADVARLACWIGEGRLEKAFREGPTPDAGSILRYQQSVRRSGWEYQCVIIKEGEQAIGYLDYRLRRRSAEILGIYLESHYRGARIGQHIFRWAIADLRERGCRVVRAEVYAENAPSLRVCQAVGFQRDVARDRVEDGRQIRALSRSIEPLRRLSSPEPRYALLRGENIYLHHVAVAEALVEEMRKAPGVEVVLGLGSLSRGFADEWSDIDLAVLGRGSGLKRFWRGERWLAGLSVDLFVVDLDAAPPSEWDDSRRQAFEESVVLFRRDPSVIEALRRAVCLGKRERSGKIRETLLRIGWLGFAPRAWYSHREYGYIWSLPHDLWIRRGSVVSAHATLDQALDHTLQLLFLTNGRHIPDPKWRRYLAPGLPWLPADFNSLIKKVDEGQRNDHGFQPRAEAVLTLIERTVQHLEDTGEISGDLYKVYLRTSSDYDPMV